MPATTVHARIFLLLCCWALTATTTLHTMLFLNLCFRALTATTTVHAGHDFVYVAGILVRLLLYKMVYACVTFAELCMRLFYTLGYANFCVVLALPPTTSVHAGLFLRVGCLDMHTTTTMHAGLSMRLFFWDLPETTLNSGLCLRVCYWALPATTTIKYGLCLRFCFCALPSSTNLHAGLCFRSFLEPFCN